MSLAVKYRPKSWDDVIGQETTVKILKHQVETNSTVSAYLFQGSSGCGKTTCALIFANEINHGEGHPIMQDAASNNSVDNVRQIIDAAKQRSLDSEYKIYIIDECHALSSASWQAFLKLLEEPPKYTKFIFCTTNPEKIPPTILSRVQTFSFSKVSDQLLIDRLKHVLVLERNESSNVNCSSYELADDSLAYIARLSNGSVRQAIAYLEKCISCTTNPTYEDVVAAIGSSDYTNMSKLFLAIANKDSRSAISIIDSVYLSGNDVKSFLYNFLLFVLDLSKSSIFDNDLSVTSLPNISDIQNLFNYSDQFVSILNEIVDIYESNKTTNDVRFMLEARIIKMCV